MRKPEFNVKLLFLTLLLIITLINLNQTLQAWPFEEDCYTVSQYCGDYVWDLCRHYCEADEDDWCYAVYFIDGSCDFGVCEQHWEWECDKGFYEPDEWCWAWDKNCPF